MSAAAFPALFRALVLRHVVAHRARTLVTVASVAIGVAVSVAIGLANASAIASFSGSAAALSPGTTVEVLPLGVGIPEKALRQVQELPGVRSASPVVAGTVSDAAGQSAYDLVGVDLIGALGLASSTAGPGVPSSGEIDADTRILRRGEIVISRRVAARLHARLGTPLKFVAGARAVTLTVGAVIDDAALPFGWRSIIICDISTAQEVLDRIGLLDRMDVVGAPQADDQTLRRELARVLPNVRIAAPDERARQLTKMTQAFQFNLAALAAIALLVGAYLVFNAVSMSVVQRRSEIGVARALGAARSTVFGVFLLEGVLVGVVGSAFGLVLGRLLARKALAVVSSTIDALYTTDSASQIAPTPEPYIAAAVLGVAFCLIASLLPALEAASVPPTLAMRIGSWESSQPLPGLLLVMAAIAAFGAAVLLAQLKPLDGRPVFGYASAIAVIAGCSLLAAPLLALIAKVARTCLPATAGAALRLVPANVQGRVRRNAVAIASLMVGIAMTVSVATLIASFRETVNTWIDETLRGDLYIAPAGAVNAADVTMPDDVLSRLRALPQVAAADALRSRAIVLRGRPTNLAASDIEVTSAFGNLPLLGGARWSNVSRELIDQPAVLVSEPFARKFAMATGARFDLQTPNGDVRLRVAGVYRDYASDLGYILMDRTRYIRLFGDRRINAVALYAKPGASISALRAATLRVFGHNVVRLTANGELHEEALAQFDRTFAVTYALNGIALVISLLGIASALGAVVIERRHEIGVLRCLGMTRRQVATMIVAEAALLGAVGAALGLVAGYALAVILVFVINRQAFGWTIAFVATPLYDLKLYLVAVATAALAGALPARAAARLPLAETVRAE
ncbi:MAG: FtsX-like permease family protein [Candidatus Eremiobacter antarcticus]|nr:FtsX-like permease family protein [Candidatus Eremiobacteraeota bacterium]MBC5807047.1 FtsX-like permease family protein [Candidatus Eremiobacteraeota bacterium]